MTRLIIVLYLLKQTNKMNTYIVIQMQVDSDSVSGNQREFSMSNVIRKVQAETQEEAIGKFVVDTQSIKAQKKLNIECYDLNLIRSAS